MDSPTLIPIVVATSVAKTSHKLWNLRQIVAGDILDRWKCLIHRDTDSLDSYFTFEAFVICERSQSYPNC